jgi:hypothetical protein
MEWNYGLSYNTINRWFVGIELMNEYVLEEGELEYSILTTGPLQSYSGQGF